MSIVDLSEEVARRAAEQHEDGPPGPPPLDALSTEMLRAGLARSIAEFLTKLHLNQIEIEAKKAVLAVAKAGRLQAGRYRPSINTEAAEATRNRLAALEWDNEQIRASLEGCQAALASLPPPPKDEVARPQFDADDLPFV